MCVLAGLQRRFLSRSSPKNHAGLHGICCHGSRCSSCDHCCHSAGEEEEKCQLKVFFFLSFFEDDWSHGCQQFILLSCGLFWAYSTPAGNGGLVWDFELGHILCLPWLVKQQRPHAMGLCLHAWSAAVLYVIAFVHCNVSMLKNTEE